MGKRVFISGGSGYLGQRLIPMLLERGHEVRALARPGSEHKIPKGCEIVIGNALKWESFIESVRGWDTFVQLVGVAHPSPSKGAEFRAIDLPSVQASVAAADAMGVEHFIYVSVAQPAPIMKDYIAVRQEGERLLRASSMGATILRPWYVLGPGHRWPYALIPFYALAEKIPAWRESARRLGLVTIDQMTAALANAVDRRADDEEIWDVPKIRAAAVRAKTEPSSRPVFC